MPKNQSFNIPEDLKTLKDKGGAFHFQLENGEVVSDPEGDTEVTRFFMKNSKGKEQDVGMRTGIRARKGHNVSILYASREKDDFEYIVAWANHDTGSVDFLEEQIKKATGHKATRFFINAGEACANTLENFTSPHSGLLTLLLLPITLVILAMSLLFLFLAGICGLYSASTTGKLTKHVEDIFTAMNPAFEVYRKKVSKFKIFMKWLGVTFLVLLVLSIILSFF